MRKINLILLIILPLLALQCNKDPEPIEQLPEATQTGKNTFGCLVDGEVWLPKGNFHRPRLTSEYHNDKDVLITANYKLESNIALRVFNINKTGFYNWNDSTILIYQDKNKDCPSNTSQIGGGGLY